MHALPCLPVIIPLLVAAGLAGIGARFPRRLLDFIGGATAASVAASCAALASRSASSPIVYWFGGWTPHDQVAVGISFVVDPIGAGLAAFVALLVFIAFVFSWGYFKNVKSLFHTLMLVFLAGMCGLCLTGDLFNLFVWFELMTAAGVALCGYESEEYGPLQGALNFAVTNTAGAYLSLIGIGLIYAQTGALNFAQIATTLTHHPPTSSILLPIAFLFIIAGFLVKSAAFPFHFWLADAHAVAPTPVCILFSGVMVELGLFATARVYWSVFAPSLTAIGTPVRGLFLTVGVLTALVGAIQCFGQRHLKRMLAFSTISHMGLMIIGFALLSGEGLAGTALYVIGHGLVKASLFICAGILLHRFSSVDELDLRGRGRTMPWTGVAMTIGAVGLCGVPPFANFSGESLIGKSAEHAGLDWLHVVFIFAGAMTGAAVLRVVARIVLGWGDSRGAVATKDATNIPMSHETDAPHRRVPWTMWTPAVVLLLLALTIATSQRARMGVQHHADRMRDTLGYAGLVLEGQPLPAGPAIEPEPSIDASAWHQALTLVLAITFAAAALYPRALGEGQSRVQHAFSTLVKPLRALHSGRIGDYVAWFILGIGLYGLFLLKRAR